MSEVSSVETTTASTDRSASTTDQSASSSKSKEGRELRVMLRKIFGCGTKRPPSFDDSPPSSPSHSHVTFDPDSDLAKATSYHDSLPRLHKADWERDVSSTLPRRNAKKPSRKQPPVSSLKRPERLSSSQNSLQQPSISSGGRRRSRGQNGLVVIGDIPEGGGLASPKSVSYSTLPKESVIVPVHSSKARFMSLPRKAKNKDGLFKLGPPPGGAARVRSSSENKLNNVSTSEEESGLAKVQPRKKVGRRKKKAAKKEAVVSDFDEIIPASPPISKDEKNVNKSSVSI